MSDELKALRQFLATDPRDVGCEAAMEILHVYAERVLAGEDPERTMPGVAAHLVSCGPCEADLRGLVDALQANSP